MHGNVAFAEKNASAKLVRSSDVVKAASPSPAVSKRVAMHRNAVQRKPRDGEAEARLIDIYKLIGQANTRDALPKAESLVADHPNFQLAQLVYGDLLAGRNRPPIRTAEVTAVGAVPDDLARTGASQLSELREESQLRLRALRERPPAGYVPSQFLALSSQNRHAIAVDASRSRLYLFENSATGLKLIADYYISVGKSGIEKNLEGDLRTPLGVYFITSNLSPNSLKDFYGSGALPLNYPNQLDIRRGKTGSGIWLHGTPREQFSRAPLSTDGCVAIANPDLERIARTVEIRTTPVVIAQSIEWVAPLALSADSKLFEDALRDWHNAKSKGDMAQLSSWYTADFTSFGKTLTQWQPTLQAEVKKLAGRSIQLKDLSFLRWKDSHETMVVTFGEVVQGSKTGPTKRQYWTRQNGNWKIFFEGTI
ncbi:MAG: L,D-transpeptidase family protein [Polaromonas sp.]|nr:L,D-transpeptidase family protein [Polaromonas sp.]